MPLSTLAGRRCRHGHCRVVDVVSTVVSYHSPTSSRSERTRSQLPDILDSHCARFAGTACVQGRTDSRLDARPPADQNRALLDFFLRVSSDGIARRGHELPQITTLAVCREYIGRSFLRNSFPGIPLLERRVGKVLKRRSRNRRGFHSSLELRRQRVKHGFS